MLRYLSALGTRGGAGSAGSAQACRDASSATGPIALWLSQLHAAWKMTRANRGAQGAHDQIQAPPSDHRRPGCLLHIHGICLCTGPARPARTRLGVQGRTARKGRGSGKTRLRMFVNGCERLRLTSAPPQRRQAVALWQRPAKLLLDSNKVLR